MSTAAAAEERVSTKEDLDTIHDVNGSLTCFIKTLRFITDTRPKADDETFYPHLELAIRKIMLQISSLKLGSSRFGEYSQAIMDSCSDRFLSGAHSYWSAPRHVRVKRWCLEMLACLRHFVLPIWITGEYSADEAGADCTHSYSLVQAHVDNCLSAPQKLQFYTTVNLETLHEALLRKRTENMAIAAAMLYQASLLPQELCDIVQAYAVHKC